MDINDRDASFEARKKQDRLLKEHYKTNMLQNAGKNILLNESDHAFSVAPKKPGAKTDAFAKGKELTSHQKGHQAGKVVNKLEEEETGSAGAPPVNGEEEPKDGEPTIGKPPVEGGAPALDAAPGAPAGGIPGSSPSGDVPPPVSTDTPEGGNVNSEGQMATQGFVDTYMKGLPSDVDVAGAVDSNGVFKTSVNDQHNGQFMVLVFPATKTIRQVADLVEPVEGGVEGSGEALPPEGGMPPVSGEVPPPTPGGDMPPAPSAGGAGGLPDVGTPPAVPGSVPPPAPNPEGEEKKPEEMTEEVCKDDNCTDPNCDVHGAKAHELKESEREKARDPMIGGRRDWKKYLGNILRENDESKKLQVDVDALKAKIKLAKKEEKAELEEKLKTLEEKLKSCKKSGKSCMPDVG